MEILEAALNYILYGVTFFAGIMLFCSRRVWKEWFVLKISIFWIVYIGVMVSLAVISVYVDAPEWLQYVNYSLSGYLIELFMLFMFREKLRKLFYNVFAGTLLRFACSKLVGLIFYFYPFHSVVLEDILSSALIILLYIPTYFLFARNVAHDSHFLPDVREVIFIFILSLLVLPMAFLESFLASDVIAYIYLIVVEVSISYGMLFFQYILYKNAKRMAHVMANAELTKHRLEQYDGFRAVIEVMNQKIHDLKHQVRDLASEHRISDEVLQNIADTSKEYDLFVKTGNEPLDTILTEKKFACASRKINVKYMVDGQAFRFLSVEDTNALFGNLIDNAMEYLVSVGDESLRTLGIFSSQTENFLKLSVENYFAGDTIAMDAKGFPRTSKSDKYMHGFGTKSIARIAQKYSGAASFRVEDHRFKAQVIFPSSVLSKEI